MFIILACRSRTLALKSSIVFKEEGNRKRYNFRNFRNEFFSIPFMHDISKDIPRFLYLVPSGTKWLDVAELLIFNPLASFSMDRYTTRYHQHLNGNKLVTFSILLPTRSNNSHESWTGSVDSCAKTQDQWEVWQLQGLTCRVRGKREQSELEELEGHPRVKRSCQLDVFL